MLLHKDLHLRFEKAQLAFLKVWPELDTYLSSTLVSNVLFLDS